jgi:hypothetical protein
MSMASTASRLAGCTSAPGVLNAPIVYFYGFGQEALQPAP